MSKHKQQEAAVVQNTAAPKSEETPHPAAGIPKPMWAAFGIILLAGIILLSTREGRAQRAIAKAIGECQASVMKEENGLNDAFGIIQFKQNNQEVGKLLSLCESNSALALEIFRNAMDQGSQSAKLVAIHSAFFLASSGALQAVDFERLTARLDPGKETDKDIRKAAQRAIADLTVITDASPEAKEKCERTPAGIPGENASPHKIQTREEKPGGKAELAIRWSDPDLAYAWWAVMAKEGSWSSAKHRFTLPRGDGWQR